VEPEGLLPCPQDPAVGPCPEPYVSSPHLHNCLNIILLPTPLSAELLCLGPAYKENMSKPKDFCNLS
jgi:hypothetical protein